MITNYPKKVAAPHIGANGNWFLGKEDTGVKASGQSTTEILPVAISPEDWDAATNQVIIDCEGVSINEEEQVVTLSPALNSKATCTACEIKCIECNNDNLTLQATTLPTEAVTIYVAITKADGAQSSGITNNVYSTEETVVGTWIDGKPIYRLAFAATLGSTVTASATTNDIADLTKYSIEECIKLDGYWQTAAKSWMPFGMNNISSTSLPNYVYMYLAESKVIRERHDATGCNNRPCRIILEYTKTTDTATVAIPSATALMDAYEEGVNEA